MPNKSRSFRTGAVLLLLLITCTPAGVAAPDSLGRSDVRTDVAGPSSRAEAAEQRRRRRRRRHVGQGAAQRATAGEWGGEHIALQVNERGATFEIDCAHGTIEELLLDASGHFSSRGEYVRERGGPDREGQRPDAHPARFTGWSDGKRMTLKITLTDTGQTIGEFDLMLGREPQMTKCL